MRKWILLITTIFFVSCKSNDKHIYMTLNSNWEFKQADKEEWLSATVPGCVHLDLYDNGLIENPFYRTNEVDQQWIDKKDWEYRTVFNVSNETVEKDNIILHFEGLDTYAEVFLNDEMIMSTSNMFREWEVDIKPYIQKGKNKLRVYFHSPVERGLQKLEEHGYGLPAANDQSERGGLDGKKISVFTRKAPYHYGWDWGPRFVTSGIWRKVELKAWNAVFIESIQWIQKELKDDIANYTARMEIQSQENVNVEVILNETDKGVLSAETISLEQGLNTVDIDFTIENPELWWTNGLGKQKLYDISVILNKDGSAVDRQREKLGIRTVKLVRKPDEWGTSFYFEVNGVPVFMKGANYIPGDNFVPRVTPERYDSTIRAAAEANMNMIRVWGGGIYENDIFYDLCDKYGILVWQDFMFACSMYPGDDEFLENVRQEAIQNVKRLRNHPSLALWCGNNEIYGAWGQPKEDAGWGWKQRYDEEQREEIWHAYDTLFHQILPDVTKKYDSARDYWPSSPMADYGELAGYTTMEGDIHYWGVWHGKHPFEEFNKNIGRFMSEYGFQSFPDFKTVEKYTLPEDWDIESDVMMAHQRSGIGNLRIREYMGWYYEVPEDFKSFLYLSQVLQAYGMKVALEAHRRNMPVTMGTLYWQLNDCWPVASWSGMDYYLNWKALHYVVKRAFEEIIVIPREEDENIAIYAVSDRLDESPLELRIKLMDFEGNILFSNNKKIVVKPNTSAVYHTVPKEEMLGSNDTKKVVLVNELIDNGEVIADNKFYFEKPKMLELQQPDIKLTVEERKQTLIITMLTDKLAKDVYLHIDEAGHFSDNYFDLLPGQEKKVKFFYNKKTDSSVTEVECMSLVDAY